MTDQELINYLLNNNLLPIKSMPAAILIAGSRLFRAPTNNSDYDIVLIVSNDEFIKYDYLNNIDNHRIIDNKYIHFYIGPTNILLRTHLQLDIKCLLGTFCAALKPLSLKDFIVINNKYITQKFINNINNLQIINKLKKLFIDSGEYDLMSIIRKKELYQIKRLYYYLIIYLELTNNITIEELINIKSKISFGAINITENNLMLLKFSNKEINLINTALDYVLNGFKN